MGCQLHFFEYKRREEWKKSFRPNIHSPLFRRRQNPHLLLLSSLASHRRPRSKFNKENMSIIVCMTMPKNLMLFSLRSRTWC
jgi:hypothetical protein